MFIGFTHFCPPFHFYAAWSTKAMYVLFSVCNNFLEDERANLNGRHFMRSHDLESLLNW